MRKVLEALDILAGQCGHAGIRSRKKKIIKTHIHNMNATIKQNTLHLIHGTDLDPDGETEYLAAINGTVELAASEFTNLVTKIGDDLGVIIEEWGLAISDTGTVVMKPLEYREEEGTA